MAKFKVPSWLLPMSSSSSNNDNSNNKNKQNRRSFSGFSHRRAKHESLPAVAVVDDDNNNNNDNKKPHRQPSRLMELAAKITVETEKLDRYVRDNGLPEPGFDVNAPDCFPPLPPELQTSRLEVVCAAQELESLVRGPRENYLNTLSLQIINNYGIAKLVPLDGAISLSQLQTKTSLDPTNLARVLRHVMTNRIFCESSAGQISHTAASRLLAQDESLQDWVGFNSEEVFPSAAQVLKALKDHPEATSLTRTGFNYAFDTVATEPMFVTLGKDPKRAKRMGGAMASLSAGEGYELRHFVDGYDLSDVDGRGGVFVDVGGSHGFVCVELARRWKGMTFVVQDLTQTVDSAPVPICEDPSVAARIRLQEHDFFEEQPVKGADVYYYRWILHNYSTPYAVKILKNLIPALKPGARVVINEHCLLAPGAAAEKPWDEKLIRGMDMIMMILFNAQERDADQFRELFRLADERFVFKGVTRSGDCRMSVVEAVWEPEGSSASALMEKDRGEGEGDAVGES
ncbi:hypothetical protein CP532_4991 [Ophiocordyceps camponoti-leonardi (nom. inval.)]|nr:hypothetical protein CP532_4991 [Ophiocordyceps camponoti-leonardi (nom. inval.)]